MARGSSLRKRGRQNSRNGEEESSEFWLRAPENHSYYTTRVHVLTDRRHTHEHLTRPKYVTSSQSTKKSNSHESQMICYVISITAKEASGRQGSSAVV
eukprot:1338779-Amorphochlora_amoeboformis.AAC.3